MSIISPTQSWGLGRADGRRALALHHQDQGFESRRLDLLLGWGWGTDILYITQTFGGANSVRSAFEFYQGWGLDVLFWEATHEGE